MDTTTPDEVTERDPLGQRRERISPRFALAQAAFEAATTPALRRRLMRARGLAVVVRVPSAGWVASMRDALDLKLPHEGEMLARDGSERRHAPTVGNEVVAAALVGGRSVFGVSQAPERLLPSALLAAADITITVPRPQPAVLARAMRLSLRGHVPRELPKNLGAGLDFFELAGALRANATATGAIRRLEAAARNRLEADASAPALPRLEDAIQYGTARDWGLTLVDDVAAAKRGEIPFSSVDRAVLHGPPGTGKTWLVRLIARACALPLIETSIADLFATSAGFLDSVIKAQRALFERAAAAAPCLLFLDEIDALPCRSKLSPRGRDWWMPVVDDFLLQLAAAPPEVIVLAATNSKVEDLDPALLRPGRLERCIEIGAPATAQGLAQVLRFHLGSELIGADLIPIARMGVGATPATAMDWVRAARRRARRERRALTLDDVAAAVAPDDDRSPDELRKSALHEAGHAVVSLGLGRDGIEFATIVRRAQQLGGCALAQETLRSRGDIERRVAVALGGRAAEVVVLGRAFAGAGGGDDSDLASATRLLCMLHGCCGLGETLVYRGDVEAAQKLLLYDGAFRDTIAAELRCLHAHAEACLRANRRALDAITDALVARRHLDGADIARLFAQAGGRRQESFQDSLRDSPPASSPPPPAPPLSPPVKSPVR
jgi:cell division protease FtsH